MKTSVVYAARFQLQNAFYDMSVAVVGAEILCVNATSVIAYLGGPTQ